MTTMHTVSSFAVESSAGSIGTEGSSASLRKDRKSQVRLVDATVVVLDSPGSPHSVTSSMAWREDNKAVDNRVVGELLRSASFKSDRLAPQNLAESPVHRSQLTEGSTRIAQYLSTYASLCQSWGGEAPFKIHAMYTKALVARRAQLRGAAPKNARPPETLFAEVANQLWQRGIEVGVYLRADERCDGISRLSEEAFLDEQQGLFLFWWREPAEQREIERYVKALATIAESETSEFFTPVVCLIDIAGHWLSVTTIAPVGIPPKAPTTGDVDVIQNAVNSAMESSCNIDLANGLTTDRASSPFFAAAAAGNGSGGGSGTFSSSNGHTSNQGSITSLHHDPVVRFYLHTAVELNSAGPLPDHLKNTIVLLGSDGRMYVLDARGVVPEIRLEALQDFDRPPTENNVTAYTQNRLIVGCSERLLQLIDLRDDKAVSNACKAFGVRMRDLGILYESLREREQRLVNVETRVHRPRARVATEMVFRVLKMYLRRRFASMDFRFETYHEDLLQVINELFYRLSITEAEVTQTGDEDETTFTPDVKLWDLLERLLHKKYGMTPKKFTLDIVDEKILAARLCEAFNMRYEGGVVNKVGFKLLRTSIPAPSGVLSALERGERLELRERWFRRVAVANAFFHHRSIPGKLVLADVFYKTMFDMKSTKDVLDDAQDELPSERQQQAGETDRMYRKRMEELDAQGDETPYDVFEQIDSRHNDLLEYEISRRASSMRLDDDADEQKFLYYLDLFKSLVGIATVCQPVLLRQRVELFAGYTKEMTREIQAAVDQNLSITEHYYRDKAIDGHTRQELMSTTLQCLVEQAVMQGNKRLEKQYMGRLRSLKQEFGMMNATSSGNECVEEGLLALKSNKYSAGMRAFKDALKHFDSLPEAHPQRSLGRHTVLNNMAYGTFRQARRKHGKSGARPTGEAAQLALEARRILLDLDKEQLGVAIHADVLNNLGSVAFFLQKFDESEEHFCRSLGLTAALYPDTHPDRVVALKNLLRVERQRHMKCALVIQRYIARFRTRRRKRLELPSALLLQRVARAFQERQYLLDKYLDEGFFN